MQNPFAFILFSSKCHIPQNGNESFRGFKTILADACKRIFDVEGSAKNIWIAYELKVLYALFCFLLLCFFP